MTRKENKGGTLNNAQIEEDLKAKGRDDTGYSYIGSQDTGDKDVRVVKTDEEKRNEGSLENEDGEE